MIPFRIMPNQWNNLCGMHACGHEGKFIFTLWNVEALFLVSCVYFSLTEETIMFTTTDTTRTHQRKTTCSMIMENNPMDMEMTSGSVMNEIASVSCRFVGLKKF